MKIEIQVKQTKATLNKNEGVLYFTMYIDVFRKSLSAGVIISRCHYQHVSLSASVIISARHYQRVSLSVRVIISTCHYQLVILVLDNCCDIKQYLWK